MVSPTHTINVDATGWIWLFEALIFHNQQQLKNRSNLHAYVMAKLLPVSTISTCGTSLGISWCRESANRKTSYSWEPVGNNPPVTKIKTVGNINIEITTMFLQNVNMQTSLFLLEMILGSSCQHYFKWRKCWVGLQFLAKKYLPIFILLGKLEPKQKPTTLVRRKAKLRCIFPFALATQREPNSNQIFWRASVSSHTMCP